ncbi:MAG: hypothetical protein HYS08_04020 [Chlamydiae bacterium]|nr:hypothetical protein [Chlamydiota bacterium]MBI3266083.1 hypothetical protein [Chlamydiota bacterium]
MKRKIVFSVIFIVLSGLVLGLFFTFRSLHVLQSENRELEREYSEWLHLKERMEQKMKGSSSSVLKDLSEVMNRLSLKEKISYLKPLPGEAELLLQNITQNEMLTFLKELDQLNTFRLKSVSITPGGLSGTLTLSLSLVTS